MEKEKQEVLIEDIVAYLYLYLPIIIFYLRGSVLFSLIRCVESYFLWYISVWAQKNCSYNN